MPPALDPRREAPDDEVGRLVGDFLDNLAAAAQRANAWIAAGVAAGT